MRGRQFGHDTREFYVIESAIASLTARAAISLRRQGSLARQATVVLRTNRNKPGYQKVLTSVRFYTPTADTGVITSQLTRMLWQDYKSHLAYHKADVMLYDFVAADKLQTDLLGTIDVAQSDRSQARMQAVDHINQKHGRGTIKQAAEALSRAWEPRKGLSSPRYTSIWQDLPEANLV